MLRLEEVSELVKARVTKRQVIAQVMVCAGCCCGKTEKGKPEIPLDWLKKAWKERKLLKTVQLTITGCLGPCDLVNVVSIMTGQEQRYFGGIVTDEPYHTLLEWAESTRLLGQPAPIPESLLAYEFDRFA
ncbi:hypothetical protein MM817_00625 [Acidibacillus sp. S0AB]|uniref:Cobalt chelatase n=1 Tax=Sulfoacidibacillus ferrooxidans TaxID=2005001 RepID=A0A9X2ADR4_9BACL|nr:hypothetical protein [Sulfoacidibacillus ferrooxidans]